MPSASPCSFNSGAGDNGYQVASSNSKCWIAQADSGGFDLRQYGAIPDNSTDNLSATQAALNAAVAGCGKLALPPGTVYDSAVVSANVPANCSVSIVGAGSGVSRVRDGTGADFIHLTLNGQTSSAHVRGFTCVASAPDSGTCIRFYEGGSADPSQTSQSDLHDIVGLGSDGINVANYWTNIFYNDFVSNILFTNVGCYGPSTPLGNCINLNGGTTVSGIYNIRNLDVSRVAYGVVYGSYIQGVNISQSNFVRTVAGVYVPGVIVAQNQLTVSSSQCGYSTYCIEDQAGVGDASYLGNYFNLSLANETGFKGPCVSCTFTGNTTTAFSTTGTVGIEITATQGGCTISGNTFNGAAVGVKLDSGTICSVSGATNSFLNNTANLTSASALSFIYGLPVAFASTSVSGAVDNGSGMVRLTVASSANFVIGEVVIVSGVGGLINGISFSEVCVILAVPDSTHIDLNLGFGGSYTSGGWVSTLP